MDSSKGLIRILPNNEVDKIIGTRRLLEGGQAGRDTFSIALGSKLSSPHSQDKSLNLASGSTIPNGNNRIPDTSSHLSSIGNIRVQNSLKYGSSSPVRAETDSTALSKQRIKASTVVLTKLSDDMVSLLLNETHN